MLFTILCHCIRSLRRFHHHPTGQVPDVCTRTGRAGGAECHLREHLLLGFCPSKDDGWTDGRTGTQRTHDARGVARHTVTRGLRVEKSVEVWVRRCLERRSTRLNLKKGDQKKGTRKQTPVIEFLWCRAGRAGECVFETGSFRVSDCECRGCGHPVGDCKREGR